MLWLSFKLSEKGIYVITTGPTENEELEKGLAQPLLSTSTDSQQNDDYDGDQEYDASEEAPEDSRRPAKSMRSAYRLLTPSVKVCACFLVFTSISGLNIDVCERERI